MCRGCKYLDLKDKKEGTVSGCIYYCKLNKCYVYVDNTYINKDKDLKRDKDTIEEILSQSNDYDDMNVSL